jgi:phosphomannomutase
MRPRLFGTAGIRGVTNLGITPDLALRLARTYGDWIVRHGPRYGSVAVGHDTRWGAEMLARAAQAGFASAGLHVQFYGCVPFGVFALNVARTRQDGGLLVTGSHLPPDRIGLILVLDDGSIAPYSLTDRLEERLASDEPFRDVPPDRVGRLEDAFHPYELYVSECMKALDAPLCRSRRFKVLADPANGAASYIAQEFLQWLGCEPVLIHYDPAPVPARPSEPRAHTVSEALRLTRQERCDLGACYDVDADRVLFIDAEGRAVSEDAVGALFALHELGPDDVCVVPVNSSGLIERVCRQIGARVEYCPIGQPWEVQAIRDHGAAFCYEESGKYYFPRRFLWPDGLYSTGRLLELLARTGKPLAQLAAELPAYHQAKRNVPVEDAQKARVMERVARLLESRLRRGRVRDVTVDGFKRVYDDHSWLLFRPSGTEPCLRVYSDAPSLQRAEELAAEGERLVQECL